jgi:hypothetical protein
MSVLFCKITLKISSISSYFMDFSLQSLPEYQNIVFKIFYALKFKQKA